MPGPPAVQQPQQPADPSASEPAERRQQGDREKEGQRKERDITTSGSCQWTVRIRNAPLHIQLVMKKPCMENWAPGIVILEKWPREDRTPALWASL